MQINRIKIQGEKGKISTVINLPDEKSEHLAILCPGFLDSKDHAHLIELANNLCEIGYTVARFDPTGTWESDGNINLYLTTQYLEDIRAVLDHMLSQGTYLNVLLGGHSRGGQVSILYAARDSRISQVLAIQPSSNRTIQGKRYEDWKNNGFSISVRDIPGTDLTREFKVSYAHVEDRLQYDVFNEIKKVKAPIILIASELDTVVLPRDVQLLYNEANEPKEFILIPSIGHDYRKNPREIEIVNAKIIEKIQTF